MKRYTIAAATLLLSTSALAWAPSSEPVAQAVKDPMVATDSKASTDVKAAGVVNVAKAEDAAWTDAQPKLQPASLATWDDQAEPAADPDLDLADEPAVADTVEPATSAAEPAEPDLEAADHGMTDASAAGVGGPAETTEVTTETAATTLAAADITPRPAAQDYPPCDPGPGDDNCIQLYEPGVRTALASWNAPTGGLLDESASGEAYAVADTAGTAPVGGPYEPVESSSDSAMNGDGVVDPALGETDVLEGM